LAAAPFGAFDVIYFHLWKFRLFERRESFKEEITHLMRGLLVPMLTLILIMGRPEGAWFWVVVGLFALDSLNSFLDVIFEPASRAPRGVPPTELAIHFVGISSMGAAWAVFMVSGWAARLQLTGLKPHTGSILPEWFFDFGYVGVAAAFLMVICEGGLCAKALTRRARLVQA